MTVSPTARRVVVVSCLDVFAPYGVDLAVDQNFRPRPSLAPTQLGPHLTEFLSREFAHTGVGGLNVTVVRVGLLSPSTSGPASHGRPRCHPPHRPRLTARQIIPTGLWWQHDQITSLWEHDQKQSHHTDGSVIKSMTAVAVARPGGAACGRVSDRCDRGRGGDRAGPPVERQSSAVGGTHCHNLLRTPPQIRSDSRKVGTGGSELTAPLAWPSRPVLPPAARAHPLHHRPPAGARSGTPIRDTSCCCRPPTVVPCLRFGSCRAPASSPAQRPPSRSQRWPRSRPVRWTGCSSSGEVAFSHRQNCRFAAPPSPFSRCSNMDGKGVSAK